MIKEFDLEELIELQDKLSEYNIVFQEFVRVGKPIFTKAIKTAAVGFDSRGEVVYLIINPEFWSDLNMTNKAFVIAHECLHIILKHGKRSKEFKNKDLLNKAMDIVINEMLVNNFDFNKYEIKNWDKLCFVETIFSKEIIQSKNIHRYGSFDYYYNLMMENQEEVNSSQQTVDVHSYENNNKKNEEEQKIEDLIKESEKEIDDLNRNVFEEITENLSNEEKQEFGEKIDAQVESEAGSNPFGSLIHTPPTPVKKIKKWEEIVRKHVRSIISYETKEKESWVVRNRKMLMFSDGLMIPGDWEHQVPEKAKYNLVFFLDASGSCKSHAERFVKLLKSIPEEVFEIDAYSFDTSLYKIDLKEGGVRGCGGTNFTILDRKVKEITKDKKRHPDAIFILSDGEGNSFRPEKPKLWHWMLTDRHTTRYIPKDSPKHKLSDFK